MRHPGYYYTSSPRHGWIPRPWCFWPDRREAGRVVILSEQRALGYSQSGPQSMVPRPLPMLSTVATGVSNYCFVTPRVGTY